MVIRIHRCRVQPGHEWEFVQGIRQSALPQVSTVHGIEYTVFGRRIQDQESHFVNVTIWRDYEALQTMTGPDVQSRLVFDGELGLVIEDSIEFFEVFGDVDPQDLVERPDL